jgi:hypothetical protein
VVQRSYNATDVPFKTLRPNLRALGGAVKEAMLPDAGVAPQRTCRRHAAHPRLRRVGHPPVRVRPSRLLRGLHSAGPDLGKAHGPCVATTAGVKLNSTILL